MGEDWEVAARLSAVCWFALEGVVVGSVAWGSGFCAGVSWDGCSSVILSLGGWGSELVSAPADEVGWTGSLDWSGFIWRGWGDEML